LQPPPPARLSRAERHPIGTYWLAGRAGAVPTGGVTRFAASLLPVPLGAAELLITPLLPELIVSLLVLSTRLQPLAPTVSAAIDAVINVLLRIEFMTTALPSNLFYAASRHARTLHEAQHWPCLLRLRNRRAVGSKMTRR
jgi:hypothetical protein